ncbi:MAG TPA: molybdate ABC transporter permease subunit [Terrimicrobiaceae bacterium]
MLSFTPELWQSVWLTLKLAFLTTIALILLGLPLAHWLNVSRWKGVVVVETLVTLPIVLPPTVIGFYLLVLFAPQNPLGQLWKGVTGHTLAFSFSGLVVGSIFYSLPFAVQPFQAALKAVPFTLIEVARISGANLLQTFWYVVLPFAKRGICAGIALSFAHTVGEFGVVLMLGGNIPGVTRVASIALYDEVQKLNYPAAHFTALVLLGISFSLLFAITLLQRRSADAL